METSSLLLTTEPQRNSRHVSALTLRGAQRGITYSRVAILDNQSQFSSKKILEMTKFRHLTRGDLCLSCVTCGRELKNSLKMSAREVIYFILTFSRAEDKPFNSSKHPKRSLSPAPNCGDFLFSMS